jgi:DNA-binding response OmpR family regulator
MARILIIDDDEAQRKVLRYRLKENYEIIDTGSPEEALALALHHKPDAILLDLMMPRYSGFEVCQTLTSMSFTQLIPVFIVSGESAARYGNFCENLGAKGYFQKPVDFDALQTCLAAALGKQNKERRREARVRLRVRLMLRGTSTNGKPLEVRTATENVSAHGFLCYCDAPLKKDDIVEVFLTATGQQFAGKARVAWLDLPGTAGQSCGFRFLENPVDWVLR